MLAYFSLWGPLRYASGVAKPSFLLLLLLLLLLSFKGATLLASCVCLRAWGPFARGPYEPLLAFIQGSPLQAKWGAPGGFSRDPQLRGLSRLHSADFRVPSEAYDRLRRLVGIKQQQVMTTQV